MKFQAFDTETINREGYGEACLLVKMTDDGPEVLDFPKGFRFIFDFLKGGRYVAWNMDFDARAIVHEAFIPYKVLERLGILGNVQWSGFRFKMVLGKYLEVKKGKEGFVVYDLKQFYGCSLGLASEKWLALGEGKKEIPKSWYSEIDACLRDDRRLRVIEYAKRDVEATQKLLDKLLASFAGIELFPKRLTSPAALSALKFGKVLKAERPTEAVNRIFMRSFYGGRIETAVLGRVENVALWDIHSAYPDVIGKLRSCRGEVVTSGRDWKYRGARYGCYYVKAWVPKSWRWGPLAVRDHGQIIFPVGCVLTWCGATAIEALREYGVRFEVFRAYEIFGNEKDKPLMPEMNQLYLMRKDKSLSLAVKLVMNSTYGKTAEARNYTMEDSLNGANVGACKVRSFDIFGSYTNFIFASEITESVRMRIWKVLHRFGSMAYFTATDSVLLDKSCLMPAGDGMGEWEKKGEYDFGVILGCGRYAFYRKSETSKNKLSVKSSVVEGHLRGFPVDYTLFERMRKCKRSHLAVKTLETESFKQWAQRFCISSLNVLRDQYRVFRIEDNKRHWSGSGEFPAIGAAWDYSIDSMPFISIPYIKGLDVSLFSDVKVDKVKPDLIPF